MSEEFTIKTFTELVQSLHQENRPKDCVILTSLKGIIHWNVNIQLAFYKISGRMWFTDTSKAIDWIEITPYNKGNLWKIRCLFNKTFHVYYGTVRTVYCTTLQDALSFIPAPTNNYKLKP